MSEKIIRIGGASGYWGDHHSATEQLLATKQLDFIVYDYLAEITMSIMARLRAKNPNLGFAVDFVNAALKPNLKEIARQGVKVISNAGGVNSPACAAAVRQIIKEAGLDLKVASVNGDDLHSDRQKFFEHGVLEMFSGEPFPNPETILSINAYLGALPVAQALHEGADIVITGRCVDTAVTLGACIAEFGWSPDDVDKLAAGTLAGHLLECGPQVTGANFTDWRSVADGMDQIGYPITEISPDGSFICTKPDDTGGVVNVGTVSEQMIYEIGDPQDYIVADVVCDFSQLRIEQDGKDRVQVSGARGYPAPAEYKVSATFADGFRGGMLWTFYGFEAEHKARAYADTAFRRSQRTLRSLNLPDFQEWSVEVLGAETHYGEARQIEGVREVVVKVAAKHAAEAGIGVLLKELSGLWLAAAPGLTGFQGGRPKPSPVVRLFSFLIPKHDVPVTIELGGATLDCETSPGKAFGLRTVERPDSPNVPKLGPGAVRVPLIKLAWGRSGDKGNKANIGIIARKPEYLPYIWSALTEEFVAMRFAHFLKGKVERFLLPGPNAINFLLHDILGGGGIASLRSDPQGKGYAQVLLDSPITIPREMAESIQ